MEPFFRGSLDFGEKNCVLLDRNNREKYSWLNQESLEFWRSTHDPQYQHQTLQYPGYVIHRHINPQEMSSNPGGASSLPSASSSLKMFADQQHRVSPAELEWRSRGHGLGPNIIPSPRPDCYKQIPISTSSSNSSPSSNMIPAHQSRAASPSSTLPPSSTLSSNVQLSPEYPLSRGRRISSASSRSLYSPQKPNDSPVVTSVFSAQRSIFRERTTHPKSPLPSVEQNAMMSSEATLESKVKASAFRTIHQMSEDTTSLADDGHDSKDLTVHTGLSNVVGINSEISSKLPKRTSSHLDGSENTPAPKTVRIAPFNIQPSNEPGRPVVHPKILSVVSNGTTTICHPHPVPASSVPPAELTPGTKVMVGGGRLVACVPTSCGGKFTPHRTVLDNPQCKCHAHIKAQILLSTADKSKGTKDKPLVIDSDDEDIQIVDSIPATKMSPSKDTMPTPIVKVDQALKNAEISLSTESVTHSTSKLMPLSPRQRAKMSADHTKGNVVPPPPVESDPSDIESVGLSLANVVSKMSKRMRINEQNDGNSSSSSGSSTSEPLVTPPIPEVNPGSVVSNPGSLVQMIQDVKRVRPYKRLRVTGRNLFQAAKSNNLEKVIALLVEGCRANSQVEAEKGRTALHAAAEGGFMDIMRVLRMVGGDLDVLDYDMRTPLFDAIENHQMQAVDYLIKAGASLKVKDQAGMTLLHLSARRGHTDLVTRLLDTGCFDINQKDDGGWTSIMWAAEDKHAKTTKLLIEKGGSVHLRDLELNIPLHWAAFAGSEDIALLLMNEFSDVNSVNKHGETPLHIATREDNFGCVQLMLNRGARIDIKNKNAMAPLEVAYAGTKSQKLIEATKILLLCQPKGRYRLLSCDISRGQENVAIPCVNEVDDEPMPPFHFVKESCEVGSSAIQWNIDTIESCSCEGDCRNGVMCQCANHSALGKIWYTRDGLLSNEIHKLDRPLIFECNRLCKCWSYCRNRVVQKGLQYPIQLFKTKRKGWGVRALCPIPQGTFLCEYTGELISDTEADLRNDDTFLFDLDCKESDQELFCIDAAKFGNISRFINHSCEPNCVPTRVFINHQDIRFPRIAFFSSKDIEIHQEICFDYGDRFWEVKKEEFFCECGTASCNYRAPDS